MKLSELPNKPFTFTLKHDFNMTGFQLKSNPDEAFNAKRVGATTFERTNTTSNIKLHNNLELDEDAIVKLIKARRVVFIYYELEKRLDVYNYEDEMKLLNMVVDY